MSQVFVFGRKLKNFGKKGNLGFYTDTILQMETEYCVFIYIGYRNRKLDLLKTILND